MLAVTFAGSSGSPACCGKLARQRVLRVERHSLELHLVDPQPLPRHRLAVATPTAHSPPAPFGPPPPAPAPSSRRRRSLRAPPQTCAAAASAASPTASAQPRTRASHAPRSQQARVQSRSSALARPVAPRQCRLPLQPSKLATNSPLPLPDLRPTAPALGRELHPRIAGSTRSVRTC